MRWVDIQTSRLHIKCLFSEYVTAFRIEHSPYSQDTAYPLWKEYLIEAKNKSCENDGIWLISYPMIENGIFDIGNVERKSRQDYYFSYNTLVRKQETHKCNSENHKKSREQNNFYEKPKGIADYSCHIEPEGHWRHKKEYQCYNFRNPEDWSPVFYEKISQKQSSRKVRGYKRHFMYQRIATKAQ